MSATQTNQRAPSRVPSTRALLARSRVEITAAHHRMAQRAHVWSSPVLVAALTHLVRAARANEPHAKPFSCVEPRAYVSEFSDTATIALEINNLDSLKDKRLMRALEPFVTDGTWEASSCDETWYSQPGRTFRFHTTLEVALPNDSHARWLSTPRKHHDPLDADTALMRKFDVYISITAFVRSDSELCRYVTDVKEEVRRVETKRIVCA